MTAIPNISDALLEKLSDFVTGRLGLCFPKERKSDLERGTVSAARQFGYEDPESFVHEILSPSVRREPIDTLASFLTVGESYFFRDEKAFEVLEKQILPEWIDSRRNQKRRLRIWSAGCATGEEPYSIAILLSRMIPNLKDWDISVRATDINLRFLQKAAQGTYTQWSFRNVPAGIKEVYFKKTQEGRYRILPHIRKMVDFSVHNLAEDNYPSFWNGTIGMDLIFCRNVIMYFADRFQKKVIRNLYDCLAEGGCLVVGPTEIPHAFIADDVPAALSGAAIFRKESSKAQRPIGFTAEEMRSLPFYNEVSRLEAPEIADTGFPQETGALAEIEIAVPMSPGESGMKEALSLCSLGSYTEAEKKIFEVLSLNPQDPKAMGLLSKVLANQGKLKEALGWCEKVITVDKLNPESHYLLGAILQEEGRIEEAVLSLKKSLYLDPGFVPAHFALGNLFIRQGRQQDSKRHFRNVLALLEGRRQDELVAGSEGMSVGKLIEMTRSIVPEETRK